MMRSLFSGISGLRNHQTRMDVIGNNVSNVNTTGFKASRTIFQDIFSQTLSGGMANTGETGGTNPTQVGLGIRLSTVDVMHTGAPFGRTDNPFDMMIENEGFFIVEGPEGHLFTRVGNFGLDNEGFLVTSEGMYVLGFVGDIMFLPPRLEFQDPVISPTVMRGLINNAIADIMALGGAGFPNPEIDEHWHELPITGVPHDTAAALEPLLALAIPGFPSNTEASHWTTPPILDGTGAVTTPGIPLTPAAMATLLNSALSGAGGFPNPAVPGHWATPAFAGVPIARFPDPRNPLHWVPGQQPEIGPPAVPGTQAFTLEQLTAVLNEKLAILDPTTIPGFPNPDVAAHWRAAGPSSAMVTNPDADWTAGGLQRIRLRVEAPIGDQFTDLLGFNVADDGTISVVIDNLRVDIAQIALALFANNNGLERAGNSLWRQTASSGEAVITTAMSDGAGTIRGGGLEMSNVDLATEFTEMIITQRGYQANSRIITVSDSLLEELVNLKR